MAHHRYRLVICICSALSLLGGAVSSAEAVPIRRTPVERMEQRHLVSPLWSRRLSGGHAHGRGLYQFATPVIAGGTVYVGSARGGVFALSGNDGKVVWRHETLGAVFAPVRLDGDRLFAVDAEGILYALEPATGRELWQTTVGAEVMAQPLVVGDRLFAVTMRGQLVAFERETGVPLWHTNERLIIAPFTVRGAADPIVHEGKIIVGYADGLLAAHSPADGTILWEERITPRQARLHDVDTVPLPADGRIIAASVGGGLAAVQARTGQLAWFERIASPNAMAMAGATLYVAGEGVVSAVDAPTGAQRWRTPLPESEVSAPVLIGNMVVVVGTDGPLYLLRERDGTLLQEYRVGSGTYGRPVVDGDRLYLLTNASRLMALQVATVE
ncbi:MAG: PQQ-binding-like beta-propeller repeat protein [Deltaproteobacteria bacterium]|nr:PQQ-binding-like beta-propeller repeat protein [Deltaproteobacteria bacterium]